MRIIVYGATRGRGDGIGHSVALALRERGHEVTALCRDPAKTAEYGELDLEALDLYSAKGQSRFKQLIRDVEPDVIWSACGTGVPDPLWSLGDHEIDEMIEANVRNNVLLCRTCAPSCLDGGPHLILTGSVAGVLEGVGTALYSGVKGFLVPFVRGQRAEYRRQGHNPKLSLLLLNAVRTTGLEIVVDAVEFVGRQSRSIELLIG
jgi:NAD(P)-dependent dehydrogenase (short-subunit alcohol dehydrogenase family)